MSRRTDGSGSGAGRYNHNGNGRGRISPPQGEAPEDCAGVFVNVEYFYEGRVEVAMHGDVRCA